MIPCQINSLPFISGAKIVVIDEDILSNYAHFLILGWLQEFKQKLPEEKIVLLLFSTSSSDYKKHFDKINLRNVEIKDYYAIPIQEDQNNISDKLDIILMEQYTSSTIVIDCLSSLALAVGVRKASYFVEKFSKKVKQLICINRSDFESSNIPSIKTLGNIYVKLRGCSEQFLKNNINYFVDCIYRKNNNNVMKESELVTQDLETYILSSKKEIKEKNHTNSTVPSVGNIEATFRLEMNTREIEQKKNVNLPYVNNSNCTSKIIYNPDHFDDLDEEDPDDDLCI